MKWERKRGILKEVCVNTRITLFSYASVIMIRRLYKRRLTDSFIFIIEGLGIYLQSEGGGRGGGGYT